MPVSNWEKKEIRPLRFAKPRGFKTLEVQLERAHIICWRGATWPVGKGEITARSGNRIYQAMLTPNALRPPHKKVTAAQPTRI